MNIQPIVEGHGEADAVPVLLRRLACEAGARDSALLSEHGLQTSVELALMYENCGGILVLFEDEDGCPAELGPLLGRWAAVRAGGVPFAIALAHREYEAWFLAALDSLRGRRGIAREAKWDTDPERPRGAKEALEKLMERPYRETQDQAALSAVFDMAQAYHRSRSFRHLVKAVGDLLRQMGQPPAAWPPASWTTAGR
ncbi:MAG: DUF4276 family protein [Elusimicrobia bacterium]|nr:DUF4276 family protein [Elusimicrobiota bacterium]